MQWTVTIPDELATRLQPVGDRLPQILKLGCASCRRPPRLSPDLPTSFKALARLPSPQEVLALRPSPALQERIDALLAKNRESGLSDSERLDWQRFQYVEHLVRMRRAQQHSNSPRTKKWRTRPVGGHDR